MADPRSQSWWRLLYSGGPTFLELAKQALSSTEKGYDLLAAKFDVTPFRTPDRLIERALAILGEVGDLNDALDVCCGTGAAILQLRARCRNNVVGIDFSAGMLAEARRLTAGDARIHLVRADARRLPFADSFSLAVCFGALGHFVGDDQDLLVASVAGSLRPGGRFAFITSSRPPIYSPAFWFAHGFGAAMRIRNAIVRPPFVMDYLTFLLPEVEDLLFRHGFSVEVKHVAGRLFLVIGTLKAEASRGS